MCSTLAHLTFTTTLQGQYFLHFLGKEAGKVRDLPKATHRGPKSPFQATSWIALFYEIKSAAKFPLRKPELRNWATLAQKLVVQLRALRSQTSYCASLGLSFFICKMSLTRILTKKGCGKVKQFHRKNLA